MKFMVRKSPFSNDASVVALESSDWPTISQTIRKEMPLGGA